jgi:hypothetical protein
MFAADSVTMIGAAVSLLGAVAVIVGLYLSRRSEHEANETQEELADFTILRGVVEALQGETNRLTKSLEEANEKAVTLNQELEAAQENVRILSGHIRRYLPEVPFPTLKPMNRAH